MSQNKTLSFKRRLSVSAYNQNGIALPLVLMLLIVLTILGTAAWTASQSSLVQATRLEPSKRAEYLARSAVDATKEAWIATWLTDFDTAPNSAQFFTRYDEASDEFVNVVTADVDDYDEIIETSLSYDPTDGVCTVESTATVDSISQTVRAVSEKLIVPIISNLDPPWYEIDNERYWDWSSWSFKTRYWGTILGNTDNRESDTHDGINVLTSYHFVDGTANLSITNNGTLYLDRNEDDNIIGYQAKHITVNCPLDLYSETEPGLFDNWKTPYCLVISAENIQFEQKITIGDSNHGNLSLHLPDGAGISGEVIYHRLAKASDKPKVDLSARYGLVSFSEVEILGGSNDSRNRGALVAGKTFYFRHANNQESLMIGTEESTFNVLADWLGITNEDDDMRLQTLLDKGYLIEAPSDMRTLKYDVLFVYE